MGHKCQFWGIYEGLANSESPLFVPNVFILGSALYVPQKTFRGIYSRRYRDFVGRH